MWQEPRWAGKADGGATPAVQGPLGRRRSWVSIPSKGTHWKSSKWENDSRAFEKTPVVPAGRKSRSKQTVRGLCEDSGEGGYPSTLCTPIRTSIPRPATLKPRSP